MRVVMYSGGVGSWATAKQVAEKHGTDNLILLFADTKMEDQELYGFIQETSENVGGELVMVEDGRTPWDVFFDVRFLGNSRIDPCSRILKRELLRKWLNDNCNPEGTVVYLGIDWTEEHRFVNAAKHWEPWHVKAPLIDPPYLAKPDLINLLKEEGIKVPEMYQQGFPHFNCGGFCIKAGHAQFRLLLESNRERFLYHEEKEQELREYLGKDVAVLRDRSGGEVRPVTLREFRESIEANRSKNPRWFDSEEWGGCGCFSEAGVNLE